MNAPLPCALLTKVTPGMNSLEWVGIQSINLPVTLNESGYRCTLFVRADAQVDRTSRPVCLDAVLIQNVFTLRLLVTMVYSLTYRWSAVLAWPLVEHRFLGVVAGQDHVEQTVSTPVQAVAKRAGEKAFAARNDHEPMPPARIKGDGEQC